MTTPPPRHLLPRTLLSGALVGAAGTLAMDLLWFRRARRDGADDSFGEFEHDDADSFDDAGAPAQVGQKVATAVGTEIPERHAGTTTDVVHWATGIGWGVGAAVLRTTGFPALASGVVAGTAAFATAYTVLPVAGIYDPIWEYDGKTLWKDASAHATYGTAAGLALAVIGAARPGSGR